jgi:hypothetical protein
MTQAVDYLPSKHKVLSSNHNTTRSSNFTKNICPVTVCSTSAHLKVMSPLLVSFMTKDYCFNLSFVILCISTFQNFPLAGYTHL